MEHYNTDSPSIKKRSTDETDNEVTPPASLKKSKACEATSDFHHTFNNKELKIIQSAFSSAQLDDPILLLKWNPIWLQNQANLVGIYHY